MEFSNMRVLQTAEAVARVKAADAEVIDTTMRMCGMCPVGFSNTTVERRRELLIEGLEEGYFTLMA